MKLLLESGTHDIVCIWRGKEPNLPNVLYDELSGFEVLCREEAKALGARPPLQAHTKLTCIVGRNVGMSRGCFAIWTIMLKQCTGLEHSRELTSSMLPLKGQDTPSLA